MSDIIYFVVSCADHGCCYAYEVGKVKIIRRGIYNSACYHTRICEVFTFLSAYRIAWRLNRKKKPMVFENYDDADKYIKKNVNKVHGCSE